MALQQAHACNIHVIYTPFLSQRCGAAVVLCTRGPLTCTAGDQGGDEDLTPAQRAVQHYSVLHREDEEVQLTGVSKATGEVERFYANGTPAERWAARPLARCVCLGTAALTASPQTYQILAAYTSRPGTL